MRLADSAALAAAIRQGEVIPAFVLDPVLLNSKRVGPKRVAWLAANLRELDRSLRAHGSQLVVRRGEPAAELVKLARETQATNVFFNLDLTPYARRRDQHVALALEQNGVTVESFDDMTVHHPEEVVTLTGRPYQVFTAFKKAWLALPKPSADEAESLPEQMPLPEELGHCERFSRSNLYHISPEIASAHALSTLCAGARWATALFAMTEFRPIELLRLKHQGAAVGRQFDHQITILELPGSGVRQQLSQLHRISRLLAGLVGRFERE